MNSRESDKLPSAGSRLSLNPNPPTIISKININTPL